MTPTSRAVKRINLHDEFIAALHEKVPKRSELVIRISDLLCIEKESASRRLNGRVSFSIREMGILASELGISIDGLLRKGREGR